MYSATLCGSMGFMVQGAGCTVTGCVCPAEQRSSSMLIEVKTKTQGVKLFLQCHSSL